MGPEVKLLEWEGALGMAFSIIALMILLMEFVSTHVGETSRDIIAFLAMGHLAESIFHYMLFSMVDRKTLMRQKYFMGYNEVPHELA
ncbi:MAG: hypothetical protein ACTSUE_05510 [Promethearchaeota archaeon]